MVWGGTVLDRRQYEQLPPDQNRLVLQIEANHFLWSVTEGPADWVNHCCTPNAGLSSSVSLVALRAISPGEEVRYDYCTSDCSDYDEFECLCGADECRGWVRGNDWMLPELWSRYDGHFAPYLAQRILALRERAASLTIGTSRSRSSRRREAPVVVGNVRRK